MNGRTPEFLILSAISIALAACDGGAMGPPDKVPVTVAFSLVEGTGASSNVVHASTADASIGLIMSGSNGVLHLTGVFLIVDEFKLGRVEATCADAASGGGEEDCEKFEAGPGFVALPMDGATAPLFTAPVTTGTYGDLKFEVKNAGSDDVLADIAAAGFTDWPDRASAAVVGSFAPADGTASRPFTAFLDAEVKIEMDFEPPLLIETDGGTASVLIDPTLWFTSPDGSVADLSAFDYTATGDVLELEAKLHNGFTKLEIDGFDD